MSTKQEIQNKKEIKKSSLAIPSLIISTAYLTASVVGIIFFLYIGEKESTLHKNLRDKTKTIVELSVPGVKKALLGGDDVAVLNYLQDIAKLPDVIYARIIDGEGNIITDDKVERWGKKITEVDGPAAARLSTARDKSLFFKRSGSPEGYDYVSPLVVIPSSRSSQDKTSKSTVDVSTMPFSYEPLPSDVRLLNVGVSSEKLSVEMAATRANAIYIVIGIVFGGIVAFYLAFYFVISSRVKKIQKSLESVLLGGISERIPQGKTIDEISSISDSVNKVLDKVSSMLASVKESEGISERVINNFIKEIGLAVEKGIVVLDASDNIIFINEKAADYLKVSSKITGGELKGQHIIEVAKNMPQILDALKKSAIELGTTVRQNVGELSLSVTAIDNGKNQVAGTVIVIE